MMLWVVVGELLLTLIATAIFGAVYLTTDPWNHGPVARLMAYWSILVTLETLSLFLLGVGIVFPLWVYATLYGFGLVIAFRRLYVLVNLYRRRDDNPAEVHLDQSSPEGPGTDADRPGVPGAPL